MFLLFVLVLLARHISFSTATSSFIHAICKHLDLCHICLETTAQFQFNVM